MSDRHAALAALIERALSMADALEKHYVAVLLATAPNALSIAYD